MITVALQLCYRRMILETIISGVPIMCAMHALWCSIFMPSKFENNLTPSEFQSGPTGSSGAWAGWQTFSWDLQLWQLLSNFAGFWPTESKFSALKDLKNFQTVSKVQEASSILRVCFALSKWPHFNSTCLLRVQFSSGIAVCLQCDEVSNS